MGDVVLYQPESIGGARIIHRAIGGNSTDGWEMKGDNNDFVDQFTPKSGEVLGTAWLVIPKVGLAAAAITSPLVWLSVIALALALLLWPRRENDDLEFFGTDDEAGMLHPTGASEATTPAGESS